jgi:hypothetical protein
MFDKNVVLDVISGSSMSLWALILWTTEAPHWQVLAYHSLLIRHVPIPVAK